MPLLADTDPHIRVQLVRVAAQVIGVDVEPELAFDDLVFRTGLTPLLDSGFALYPVSAWDVFMADGMLSQFVKFRSNWQIAVIAKAITQRLIQSE